MNVVYSQHEGSQATTPLALEITPTSVYLRKNIEQFEHEEDGQVVTLWRYDEAQLNHTDYATYIAENADAKAEYIAMMTDVDLMEG